jgi:hypothetical protein
MTIKEKDQKLLWGRGAARCSFKECRAELTDTTPKEAGRVVLGEMAHIVGESEAGPRGKSVLTDDQRASYANLILLCSHHHTMIDKNPDKYPVELLHQIKTEHEQWVVESLGSVQDAADLVYGQIIDDISIGLDLEHWAWWTDHAVRDLLPLSLAQSKLTIEVRRKSTHWPGKHKALDGAAEALMDSFVRFVRHFETFCEMRGDQFLGQDNSLKRLGTETRYTEYSTRAEVWRELNFFLLCDLAERTETFASAVRGSINARFYAAAGCFLVHDSMEMRGRGPAFCLGRSAIDEGIAKWRAEEEVVAKKYLRN